MLPEAHLEPFAESPARPLDGVRVLDLTTAVAGPVAALLLGALGAEVLRIETPWARPQRPASALPYRGEGPDEPWNREARLNELANSKRSVALNLTHADGRAVFLDLVARSDIVLENFSPRVMGKLRSRVGCVARAQSTDHLCLDARVRQGGAVARPDLLRTWHRRDERIVLVDRLRGRQSLETG